MFKITSREKNSLLKERDKVILKKSFDTCSVKGECKPTLHLQSWRLQSLSCGTSLMAQFGVMEPTVSVCCCGGIYFIYSIVSLELCVLIRSKHTLSC